MSEAVTATAERAACPRGLELAGVGHAFEGPEVVTDVSMAVARGETVGLIGPSGTGKTTLLRLLALFEPPTAGTVRIDGTNVWAEDEGARLAARRQLGMVFQTPNLFAASVKRNVAYGRHIRRDWTDRLLAWKDRFLGEDLDEIHAEALRTVDMLDAADQDADTLSGGEAQRVAFARALACDPDFLLLDEPTSDLDPRNTAIIEEAIATARDRELGVIVATHDMHQAERIADRVAVMIGGSIVELGPTASVFDDPDDDRVRQFIEGELVY